MAVINPLTPAGVDAAVRLMLEAYIEAERYHGIARYDADVARATAERHLEYPRAGWLAEVHGAPVAVLLGHVSETFFGRTVMAQQNLLYCLPPFRGAQLGKRLVRTFEAWARTYGAVYVVQSVSSGLHEDRTVRLLEHCGYEHAGTLLRKELT